MAERARAVQEDFENRQTSTAEALAELLREVESNETRKKEQAEKSFDGLTYFVYRSLLDAKIQNAEAVSRKIREAFTEFPNWQRSENALRELRKKVTFAIFAETDNLDQVTAMVDELFTLLEKADSDLENETDRSQRRVQTARPSMGRQAGRQGRLVGCASDAQQMGVVFYRGAFEFQRRTTRPETRAMGLRDRPRAAPLLCAKSWKTLEKPDARPPG
jgi:DNA repair exonuclease SbcCD ATPase subunit